MKRISIHIALIAVAITMMTGLASADWILPVSISASDAETNIQLGVESGTTDGYDAGYDSASPMAGGSLNAYFYHPEWDAWIGDEKQDYFYKDIRGTMPQDFTFIVESSYASVDISWDRSDMPNKSEFWLYDDATAQWTDMSKIAAYTASGNATLTIRASWGDMIPPAVPSGVEVIEDGLDVFVRWSKGTEPDLDGYKIHFGKSGTTLKSVPLKKVSNYMIMGLAEGEFYEIQLSAFDKSGNESARTSAYTYQAYRNKFNLMGTVYDTNGIGLSNVLIEVRNSDGNVKLNQMTDASGGFEFIDLRVGQYRLKAKNNRNGFRPVSVNLTEDKAVDIVGRRKGGKNN